LKKFFTSFLIILMSWLYWLLDFCYKGFFCLYKGSSQVFVLCVKNT
jgi:hypothetical protein